MDNKISNEPKWDWNSELLSEYINRLESENAELRERLNTQWTTTCKCENSRGETWCCNICGKPTPRTDAEGLLVKYAEHLDSCIIYKNLDINCNCGLTELLNKFSKDGEQNG
jgi:hypothetical protein